MAMLNFFYIKHSKTAECTKRSFGLTATCHLETSSVQGVYHAGVAVELGHKLKNIKLVMVFLSKLFYNFTFNLNLAECIGILFVIWMLGKSLHHAGVAVNVVCFTVQCLDKIIFSLSSWLLERQMKEMIQESMELYKKMQNPNFFLLWECYSYLRMSTRFGFCLAESFPLDHVGASRIFLSSYSTSLAAIVRQSSSIIYRLNCC